MPDDYNSLFGCPLFRSIFTLLIIGVVGAFGGYLSMVRKKPLGSTETTKVALLQGFAGAIIIFTLAPVDPKIIQITSTEDAQTFVRLIALALIGGYAGGSLLETSAGQYLRRVTTLEEKQKCLEEDSKKIEEQAEQALNASNWAEEILRGLKLSPNNMWAFKKALKDGPVSTRYEIAHRADEVRRQCWKDDKESLERCLLIFETLVAADERPCHWWFASLAYCLKDKFQPNYALSLQYLNTAIELRGGETRSGAYEFNRAICNIRLSYEKEASQFGSSTLSEQIRKDLEVAGRFPRFAQIIKADSEIQDWLNQNSLIGEIRSNPTPKSTDLMPQQKSFDQLDTRLGVERPILSHLRNEIVQRLTSYKYMPESLA
jgi:hypothetical protein